MGELVGSKGLIVFCYEVCLNCSCFAMRIPIDTKYRYGVHSYLLIVILLLYRSLLG